MCNEVRENKMKIKMHSSEIQTYVTGHVPDPIEMCWKLVGLTQWKLTFDPVTLTFDLSAPIIGSYDVF